MSPLVVRRYRAERLLRDEFEGLRAKVLGIVGDRLRGRGVHLDAGDLEACYSQAWQGLYAAVLDGERIDSTAAWLALVTYRRAIDEHRARRGLAAEPPAEDAARGGAPHGTPVCSGHGTEQDIAAALDDRARLRQLFEALRAQLSAREQQAATLCYLQALSRAQAAAHMGVSESRMRKLMEGRGARSPGVASKVGALVQTIAAGGWCEEQGSLMRGLAYGILDPDGERYRLALLHRDACPACRAYVLSLRGLAAVLPPAPVLLHWALGAGSSGLAGAGAGATPAIGGTPATGGPAAGASPASSGAGAAALSAPGVAGAGAGAAGGGWWLAGGPFGAKLAVSCLVALGVGAGCAALGGSGPAAVRAHRHRQAGVTRVDRVRAHEPGVVTAAAAGGSFSAGARAAASPPGGRVTAAAQASREFGPEQSAGGGAPSAADSGKGGATATAAAAGRVHGEAALARGGAGSVTQAGASATTSAGGQPAAQREFAPG